jgi:predicted transcriptional regulator
MKIKEVMTKDVKVINYEDSIQKAAQMMKDQDIGCLPVEKDDKLMGMVTDRDIALWVAESASSLNPANTSVSNCTSEGMKYCFEDDDLETIMKNMGEIRCRRLAVMDSNKKLVGIVSLKDLAMKMANHTPLEQTLERLSTSA